MQYTQTFFLHDTHNLTCNWNVSVQFGYKYIVGFHMHQMQTNLI